MVTRWLNSYFGFNRQQRNGLLVLATISLVLLGIRIVAPLFIASPSISISKIEVKQNKTEKSTPTLFAFDPNTVSKEQLVTLGLNEKTATTFLKLRKKGFVFRKKEDVKKVYGISATLYEQLGPYIYFSPKNAGTDNKPKPEHTHKKIVPLMVDLNTADTIALEKLKGIGAVFARRIIKYRSLLGGFANKEQLKEVYGLSNEQYNEIEKYVRTNGEVTKIDLNAADFKTINKHPYISYELTCSIFKERKKEKVTLETLRGMINDDLVFERLSVYILP